jgi:hypothetical protein
LKAQYLYFTLSYLLSYLMDLNHKLVYLARDSIKNLDAGIVRSIIQSDNNNRKCSTFRSGTELEMIWNSSLPCEQFIDADLMSACEEMFQCFEGWGSFLCSNYRANLDKLPCPEFVQTVNQTMVSLNVLVPWTLSPRRIKIKDYSWGGIWFPDRHLKFTRA